MSAIAERFRDGDNRYYWQDIVVFICVALTMGYEVPFGMPLEFADVRAQVAEFSNWLEATKFTASAERCGWEPSQDGATLLNLPPVDLPAAPFDNFKEDEREGHSWEDWRTIWFQAYIVY